MKRLTIIIVTYHKICITHTIIILEPNAFLIPHMTPRVASHTQLVNAAKAHQHSHTLTDMQHLEECRHAAQDAPCSVSSERGEVDSIKRAHLEGTSTLPVGNSKKSPKTRTVCDRCHPKSFPLHLWPSGFVLSVPLPLFFLFLITPLRSLPPPSPCLLFALQATSGRVAMRHFDRLQRRGRALWPNH